jgi:hypothetical protein
METRFMGYAELLSDPRWQRKRLEVMDRDGWKCKTCEDRDSTLTVHHKSYRMTEGKFADPWDYNDSDLITLCEKCHSKEETSLDTLKKTIYFDIRSLCESADDMNDVIDFLGRLFRQKDRRLTGSDLHVLLHIHKIDLEKQLKSYVAELSEIAREDKDKVASCMVDCCNFLLINGLYDGGES